jgi:hypothetical protein
MIVQLICANKKCEETPNIYALCVCVCVCVWARFGRGRMSNLEFYTK